MRKGRTGWGKARRARGGVAFNPVDGSLPHSPPPSVITAH